MQLLLQLLLADFDEAVTRGHHAGDSFLAISEPETTVRETPSPWKLNCWTDGLNLVASCKYEYIAA